MKLILAIVNNDDAHSVNAGLSAEGFSATKISSTGGFLMSGNSTFLIGVADDETDKAIAIIASHSQKREHAIPLDLSTRGAAGQPTGLVTVGGATVFVLNVEDCRRL